MNCKTCIHYDICDFIYDNLWHKPYKELPRALRIIMEAQDGMTSGCKDYENAEGGIKYD